MSRPVLYVLAGVNGAGKSSVGGYLLQQAGLGWFNPDTFARELVIETGCRQEQANAMAWQEGMRRLDVALEHGHHYAFETTLGGNTVPSRILAATRTHDVIIWFCGLTSPEQHIARVQARVAAGGHPIAETRIRERYPAALENLIALMPHLAHLRIYDNSVQADDKGVIPDPWLLAEMQHGKLIWPLDMVTLQRTPTWAKPLLEAALLLSA